MKSLIRLALGLACMAMTSCVASRCWHGGIPMRPTELQAHSETVADFGDTSKAVVYRGLAHPEGKPQTYHQQVAQGGWIEIEGFKFFEEPVAVSRQEIDKVLALYKRPDSHQAWGPKDKCAGFHPDYVVVWTSAGKQRVLQLCYGCHEWKFFGPGGTLHTDISEVAYFGPLTENWLVKETP